MGTYLIRALLWVGMLTSFCYALPAQEPGKTGTIVIEVKDQSGAIVPNGQVQLLPTPNTIGKNLTTGDDGKLSLDVPAGNYDLSVRFPGFFPFTKHIEVQNDTRQIIAVALEVFWCSQDCPESKRLPHENSGLITSNPTTPKFSLAINTQEDTAKIGSAVRLIVTTTNRSGQKWLVSECRDHPIMYDFTYEVFDANGNMPPRTKVGRNIIDRYPDLSVGGHCAVGGGDTEIQDGQSLKPEEIVISDLFVFRPGKYTIQLELPDSESRTTVKSNTITVTVTP